MQLSTTVIVPGVPFKVQGLVDNSQSSQILSNVKVTFQERRIMIGRYLYEYKERVDEYIELLNIKDKMQGGEI